MDLQAPAHWRCLDFISDLHLQKSEPATFAALQSYLANTAADALFILGDLFEVWIGDDALGTEDSFEAQCVHALRAASTRMDLFIMHGNRDFLMGPALMAACGARFLEDPTLLVWAEERYLLSHGDALCLADTDYMQFRSVVRTQDWQEAFLAKPLFERQRLARDIRTQSENKKQAQTTYDDLDTPAVLALLDAHSAKHMIHGHTHKPARHLPYAHKTRDVLSDWHLGSPPERAEVFRMQWSGVTGERANCERIQPANAATRRH
jgi:UDP-2,3-diacylglucosamine hydrolase